MASKKKEQATVSSEAVARIRASIEQWQPGKWAEEVGYGPACLCGLKKADQCARHPRSDNSEDPKRSA